MRSLSFLRVWSLSSSRTTNCPVSLNTTLGSLRRIGRDIAMTCHDFSDDQWRRQVSWDIAGAVCRNVCRLLCISFCCAIDPYFPITHLISHFWRHVCLSPTQTDHSRHCETRISSYLFGFWPVPRHVLHSPDDPIMFFRTSSALDCCQVVRNFGLNRYRGSQHRDHCWLSRSSSMMYWLAHVDVKTCVL